MIRIGIFGAPVTRPLDFVDAFLGGQIETRRSESEENGWWRVFVVECVDDGRELQLRVSIPPRHGAQEAFASALSECDAAILLAGAGGWREQEKTLDAFAVARAAQSRDLPLVHVINDFVPPRLDVDPTADEMAGRLGATHCLRGRICWWRHEKTGTEVARAAVARAAELSRA